MAAPATDLAVVIPVYNGTAYLAEAVESVRRQTRPARRIILVDDGSTDGTPQLAQSLCDDGREPTVQCVRQDNAGPAAAMNHGASLVTESLIAFLSADDIWVPDKTDWQLKALRQSAQSDGAELVFGHMQNFISPELDEVTAAGLQCPPDPMPGNSAGTLLTRRETFRTVGPFNEGFRVGEFIDWYGRAGDLGFKSAMLPQVVTLRRLHGHNHSLTRRTETVGYAHVLKTMLDRRRAQRGEP
jgi:glycosyltransferase involved in cell wall biosynthesis